MSAERALEVPVISMALTPPSLRPHSHHEHKSWHHFHSPGAYTVIWQVGTKMELTRRSSPLGRHLRPHPAPFGISTTSRAAKAASQQPQPPPAAALEPPEPHFRRRHRLPQPLWSRRSRSSRISDPRSRLSHSSHNHSNPHARARATGRPGKQRATRTRT